MAEIIKCKKIIFEGFVETRKWGLSSGTQTSLTSKDCTIEIDTGERTYRIIPNRPDAEPFEGPMEKVKQWFRATPQPTKRRTAPAAEA